MIGEKSKVAVVPGPPNAEAIAQDMAVFCECCQTPLANGQEAFFLARAHVWREEIDLIEPIGAFCSVECLQHAQCERTGEDPANTTSRSTE